MRSVLIREESRGLHFRSDFPTINMRKMARKHLLSLKRNGRMTLHKQNVKKQQGLLKEALKMLSKPIP